MNKTRQWTIFTVIAVLVVLAGGYELLVSPQRSKASDVNAQVSTVQSQTATLHAQLAQLETEKRNLPEQQKILAQIATEIPADPAEPTLIRQLQANEETAGVDMSSLSPGTPAAFTGSTPAAPSTATATSGTATTAAPTLYQIPLSITVDGSYFNDEMFLHLLEQMPRALVASAVSETPGAGGSAGGSGTTSASTDQVAMTITAEVFLSPTNAAAAPAVPTTGSAAAGTTTS